jgi:hypothetical protein
MKWFYDEFWINDQSPALITWIENKHTKRISIYQFPEMLYSMITDCQA